MSVDKITQKIAIHLPDYQSVFTIQSSNLSHIFGCDLEQIQTGLMMREKYHYILSILTTS